MGKSCKFYSTNVPISKKNLFLWRYLLYVDIYDLPSMKQVNFWCLQSSRPNKNTTSDQEPISLLRLKMIGVPPVLIALEMVAFLIGCKSKTFELWTNVLRKNIHSVKGLFQLLLTGSSKWKVFFLNADGEVICKFYDSKWFLLVLFVITRSNLSQNRTMRKAEMK